MTSSVAAASSSSQASNLATPTLVDPAVSKKFKIESKIALAYRNTQEGSWLHFPVTNTINGSSWSRSSEDYKNTLQLRHVQLLSDEQRYEKLMKYVQEQQASVDEPLPPSNLSAHQAATRGVLDQVLDPDVLAERGILNICAGLADPLPENELASALVAAAHESRATIAEYMGPLTSTRVYERETSHIHSEIVQNFLSASKADPIIDIVVLIAGKSEFISNPVGYMRDVHTAKYWSTITENHEGYPHFVQQRSGGLKVTKKWAVNFLAGRFITQFLIAKGYMEPEALMKYEF